MPQSYKRYTNPMQDGRRKLSPELHPEIEKKYATGTYSWKDLAFEYGVSKGSIGMIVSEKYRNRVIAYRKGRWKIYADKEMHRKAIKKFRDKKRSLGLSFNPAILA